MAGVDDGRQIQVYFETTLPEPFKVTTTPFAVPARLSRYGLSEIINHLLELPKPRPFDFLISGELIRCSLLDFLANKGISSEEIIAIQYVLLPESPEEKLEIPHEEWISAVSIGSIEGDSTLLLSGSYDKCARVWSDSGELKAILKGHKEVVTGVAWATRESSKNSPQICVTSSKDYTLRSYCGEGDRWDCIFQYTGHEDSVQAVTCDPSGKFFCSSSWDKTLKVWAVPTGTEAQSALESEAAAVKPKREAKSRKEAVTSASVKERGCLNTLMGHNQAVTCVAWPAVGEVVSGSWDNSIRAWDVETQTNTTTISAGHAVNGVAVSSAAGRSGGGGGGTAGLIASAHSDRMVRVWDPRVSEGSMVRSSLGSHKGWVNAVAWSPTNDYHLASASHDNTVKLWDMRARIPLHTLPAHAGKALCLAWGQTSSSSSGGGGGGGSGGGGGGGGGLLCSGGTDGKLKMFRPDAPVDHGAVNAAAA